MIEHRQVGSVFFAPGDTFGDYHIREKLQDSCSDCFTFRATHLSSGADVALKIFHISRPQSLTLFETEVQSLQKIQGYPGIHPLRDFGEKDDVFFIATNYIEGGSLRNLLQKHPDGMDLQEVLRLFSPIADAIDYCHAMGIVHRDLKPGNILLDETAQGPAPLLADFGIARILNESRAYETASFSGTLCYSAPETFDQESTKTYAVDIYSLGVILYEILEGQVPFQDPDPIRIIELHKNAPVPYPQRIANKTNHEVVLALLRALAKNPVDRPQSAGKLLDDIRRAASTAPGINFWAGPGKQIDDYTIESNLSTGRFSQTFLAREADTADLFVLKLFFTGDAQSDSMRAFKDEITALKSLGKTKGILPLLDIGETTGFYYLVTKYMPEGSLRRHLVKYPKGVPGGLPIKEVIHLFTQIAEAIDAIHKRGIIHRDLKPENVVLARRDGMLDAYLMDFGIARVLADTQSFYTQNVTGTFRYMAPEVWDPGMKKSAAVDIYAFGVMLYEALEGRPPFDAEYPAIIQQHVSADIPQLEYTSREFGTQAANVVTRALAKKAADRPKSAAEIIQDLKRCIPGFEMIGERFATYRIERFLGASAVGQTFKAQDERNGEWVAIKILPYANPTQELEIYQKLAPQLGILSLRDSGMQEGRYFLVTDYANGGNLRQFLERGPEKPDVQSIFALFRSIAGGVDRLHQMKIVHRDLKPENVVLCEAEHGVEPYITDFGISKTVSQTQSFYTSTVAGTSYYTAPEAWTPGARQTYAVDIYALGIMLYEALEGDLPFKAEYPAIGLQHLSAEVPYPKKIAAQGGPKAVKILLRALEKDPKNRPESAAVLVDDLYQAYARYKPGPQLLVIGDILTGLGKALRGHRKVAAAAGLMLMVIIASFIWAARTVPPTLQPTMTGTGETMPSSPTSIFPATSTRSQLLPLLATSSPTATPSPTATLTSTEASFTSTATTFGLVPTKTNTVRPQAPATQTPRGVPSATKAPPPQATSTEAPRPQPTSTEAPPPAPTSTRAAPTSTPRTGKPPTKVPKPTKTPKR